MASTSSINKNKMYTKQLTFAAALIAFSSATKSTIIINKFPAEAVASLKEAFIVSAKLIA